MRKQRRLAGTLIFVGALLVIGLLRGKALLAIFVAPRLPGYLAAAPAASGHALDWQALRRGQWNYPAKPKLTAAVSALDGAPVAVRGFLLPLHEPGASTQFFIAEKPRGCYFCNPPGVAEVIQVNVAGGNALTPTDWPVHVYGTFKTAHGGKDDAALYTIDNAVLVIGK